MPRPIRVRALPQWREPEAVFLALAAEAPVAAWLDGGADASDGRSVIAVAHDRARVVVAHLDPAAPADSADDVLDELRAGLAAERTGERTAERTGDRDGDARAGERSALGWIGWFGYEFGAAREGVPVSIAATPDAAFFFADRAIVFDHATRAVRLEWLGDPDGDAWAADTEDLLRRLGEASGTGSADASDASEASEASEPSGSSATSEPRAPHVTWRHDDATYARLIADCQAAIRRGDAYQLCLTNRVDVEVAPDPVEAYLRLRRRSPSHHGGYLRFGDVALLSASPEQFLLVEPDGRVFTKPMKGTRPRGADPASDEALRVELLESEKERAENLMIVDLMRNDLSRIAELGSVHVPVLLETEAYPQVHQLVSTVAARLEPPLTAVDAVAAAFPAGSMTGAPKVSAMTILHGLEQGPRGVYSGTFGCLAVDGSADLAMVIRSIVLTPDGASIGTGGGITALSVASEEIEETKIKARALVEVLVGRAPSPIQ